MRRANDRKTYEKENTCQVIMKTRINQQYDKFANCIAFCN